MENSIFEIIENAEKINAPSTEAVFGALDTASGVQADAVDAGAEMALSGIAKQMQEATRQGGGSGEPSQITTPDTTGGQSVGAVPPSQPSITNGGYEMGVDMYIVLLEQITNLLGKWWAQSDEEEYLFEKSLKKSYREISLQYAKSANIVLSPGIMFLFGTIIVVGASGIKAHKKRTETQKLLLKRREAAAKIQPKKTGQQMELFAPDEAVTKKGFRKDYKFDSDGYYTHDQNGVYIKRGDRKEKANIEVMAYTKEYSASHGETPTNRMITEYLKQL